MTCATCETMKNASEMYFRDSGNMGMPRTSNLCKECRNASMRTYNAASRARRRAENPRHRQNPVEKMANDTRDKIIFYLNRGLNMASISKIIGIDRQNLIYYKRCGYFDQYLRPNIPPQDNA